MHHLHACVIQQSDIHALAGLSEDGASPWAVTPGPAYKHCYISLFLRSAHMPKPWHQLNTILSVFGMAQSWVECTPAHRQSAPYYLVIGNSASKTECICCRWQMQDAGFAQLPPWLCLFLIPTCQLCIPFRLTGCTWVDRSKPVRMSETG